MVGKKKGRHTPAFLFFPGHRRRIAAVREGRLLYRDAFDLTGLRGATFDRYIASLEGSAGG